MTTLSPPRGAYAARDDCMSKLRCCESRERLHPIANAADGPDWLPRHFAVAIVRRQSPDQQGANFNKGGI
jgi:hypothetical protein